ncbi:MAG: pyruvate kinase [Anaerostipes hadrus]
MSAPLESDIFCAEVIKGGELTSRKSIAIKDLTVPLPVLTKTDKENLKLLRKYHVTGVMLPFVRNADDLITLRKELMADNMDYIRIFAKIESIEGVEHLPSLLPFCDEIVIARGDLGNAIPLPKLPAVQKGSPQRASMQKTFMVVTQMLASMEENPVPTRAEVTDIFQAILDGASSLMLTGETAIGAYPEEAMKILSQTSEEDITV